jgi:2-polyprenyl-6-hydroxyphenyl methylase/3-demethylubiquinone-9 3-methyltransferase
MKDYYIENLSGNHLHRVYSLADEPVKIYLQGEIEFIRARISPGDRVLELGCGYGRILKALASDTHITEGIDNAPGNIELAGKYLDNEPGIKIHRMSVDSLDFDDNSFDLVLCTQNGLSAFGLDPLIVVREACRVTKHHGRLFCCTYAESFWPSRLQWFRNQVDAGLLGAIDETKTGNGVIACVDGFRSASMTDLQFQEIASALNLVVDIFELPSGSLISEFRYKD